MTATAGCILPSCIIVTIIARLYLKYRDMEALQSVLSSLRPAVVSLIRLRRDLDSDLRDLAEGPVRFDNINWLMVLIFFFCLFLLQKIKANPILIMVASGLIYTSVSLIF